MSIAKQSRVLIHSRFVVRNLGSNLGDGELIEVMSSTCHKCFDQLLGARSTQKLVEIHNTPAQPAELTQ